MPYLIFNLTYTALGTQCLIKKYFSKPLPSTLLGLGKLISKGDKSVMPFGAYIPTLHTGWTQACNVPKMIDNSEDTEA